MEQRIRLRDGRHIGVREHGIPDGNPVVWCVGTGGSRRWQPPDRDAARRLGVRLVVVERPGFGVSEFQRRRRILDWPDDFAQVLDGLGIARAVVAGTSGAGPFLCATAARLPDRCSRLGLIACVGPLDTSSHGLSFRRHMMFGIAARAPWLVERAMRGKSAEQIYRDMTADAPPCDRAILARPEVWRSQVEMLTDALQQGVRGFAWEVHLAARPWGFRLNEIRVPVRVWHGTEDSAAPIAMARGFEREIPSCHATFLEGLGHFLHYDRWETILAELSQPLPRATTVGTARAAHKGNED